MIDTAWIIAVSMGSLLLVGLPVLVAFARLSRVEQTSSTMLWASAPFVGLGAIVLLSQNLLYLGVRLPISAALIWATTLAGWLALLSSRRSRALLLPIPFLVLGIALAIYVLQGLGLFVLGAKDYVGGGWVDSYNYVSQAQFLLHYPLNATPDGHQYLRTAQFYIHDRIGQTLLHGFVAASSLIGDAKETFGAVILLGPWLVFFAMLILGAYTGLGQAPRLLVAGFGALLPAVASIHLECFFCGRWFSTRRFAKEPGRASSSPGCSSQYCSRYTPRSPRWRWRLPGPTLYMFWSRSAERHPRPLRSPGWSESG